MTTPLRAGADKLFIAPLQEKTPAKFTYVAIDEWGKPP